LSIWEYFQITSPTALGAMSIGSAMGATDREMFEYNNINMHLIRREFRPHGPSQVTGHGAELLDEYDPYMGYDAEKFPLLSALE
jgi:hypothetical protein